MFWPYLSTKYITLCVEEVTQHYGDHIFMCPDLGFRRYDNHILHAHMNWHEEKSLDIILTESE